MPVSDASEPVSSLSPAPSCCVFLVVLLAELRRAQVRQRLDDVQLVRAAEKGEEVLRVIGEDRQRALLRQLSGEDGGDGLLRVRVHRRRAAEPDGVPGERGEVRETNRVDPLRAVHQRDRRKLVEHDEHHRRARVDGDGLRLGLLREHELRHGRVEEEQREEDDRRCDEEGEERPHRLRAQVQERGRGAEQSRRHERARAHRACRSSSARAGRSRATSPPTRTRWSTHAAAGLTSPTTSSSAVRASGGNSVRPSANRTMSPLDEPRTAKKAGFLPRMSKSGCANANAQSAVR